VSPEQRKISEPAALAGRRLLGREGIKQEGKLS
jgi:hypothetical protein